MWLIIVGGNPREILEGGTTMSQVRDHREAKQAEINGGRSDGTIYSNSGFVTVKELPVVEPMENQ